jgi:hypothetical protein
MKAFVATAAVLIVASSAYAQQPQFTTCSQAAEFAKQACVTNTGGRVAVCQNRIETGRQKCLQTGTFSGWNAGTYPNLRRE